MVVVAGTRPCEREIGFATATQSLGVPRGIGKLYRYYFSVQRPTMPPKPCVAPRSPHAMRRIPRGLSEDTCHRRQHATSSLLLLLMFKGFTPKTMWQFPLQLNCIYT